MDIGYHIINLYIILFIFCIVAASMAIIKKKYEHLSWMFVLLLCCIIGIGFGWKVWFRVFSATYGIVWGGGG